MPALTISHVLQKFVVTLSKIHECINHTSYFLTTVLQCMTLGFPNTVQNRSLTMVWVRKQLREMVAMNKSFLHFELCQGVHLCTSTLLAFEPVAGYSNKKSRNTNADASSRVPLLPSPSVIFGTLLILPTNL